jgi:hypothetical protein
VLAVINRTKDEEVRVLHLLHFPDHGLRVGRSTPLSADTNCRIPDIQFSAATDAIRTALLGSLLSLAGASP